MHEWDGSFELVDPREIIVDHRYQRTEKPSLIASIAANLDWAAYGTLSCYRRSAPANSPDGKGVLVCVDGQQRLCGALESEDPPKKVPVIVFDKANLKTEAQAFAVININRLAVNSLAKHRSLTVAQQPAALAINRAVEKAGYTINMDGRDNGPHDIMAISALYTIHSLIGEEGLVQTLVQARDAWPDDRRGVSAHMLRGIANLIMEKGEEYNRPKLTTALSRSEPNKIERRADAFRFDLGGSKQVNIRRAFKALCKIEFPPGWGH